MPRRKLAGTYDAQWERTKKPLLPDDYDPAFALSAPGDQRLDESLTGCRATAEVDPLASLTLSPGDAMPTPEEVEPQMESLLLRTVPGLAEQWRGATPATIEKIERIAGLPLPSFYRWFLSRMGQSMGPLAYPTLDFSAERVLACYAQKRVQPDPRFLLIAYESDEMMPLHLFYDFKAPARNDAMVTSREARGKELTDSFETLREMLAWGALSLFRIDRAPHTSSGSLKGDTPDFLTTLDPVMSSLGFDQPIPTGPLCRLYERPDAVMVCMGTPRSGTGNRRAFDLGGNNAGSPRRILGEIASARVVELQVKE